VQWFASGDFVPCTAVNAFLPPNKGSCSGTKGNSDGALQSSPGYGVDANGDYWSQGFWAYRDITLPPNTVEWTWGVTNAFSRGVSYSEGNDVDESYLEYSFGAIYKGAIAPEKPAALGKLPLDPYFEFNDGFEGFPIVRDFERSTGSPYKWTLNDRDVDPPQCWSIFSGPAEPFYDADSGYCVTEFSTLLVKGKGRVWMGTIGSEPLGTRLTFQSGFVFAYHK
jgi:hypothetical protein